jgi:hypothetical protein
VALIKVSTLTAFAGVGRHTVPYVLKAVPALLGGTRSAGRGAYRVFSPGDAYRIATVAILVDHGFNLHEGQVIAAFCEVREKLMDRAYAERGPNASQLAGARGYPPTGDLNLWVADRGYVAVHRRPELVPHVDLGWFGLDPVAREKPDSPLDAKAAKAIAYKILTGPRVFVESPIVVMRLNLSRLRQAFARHAEA